MRTIEHKTDFCVVGGGLAGLSAAVTAARHGAKVVLMQDRPVLGGNASSEIRMWVCGAHGANMRETGLVEEIRLDNIYRNRNFNFSIWDSILYEKARFEPNLTLLLNCSCNAAEMDGDRIKTVKGWQLTSETWHLVTADLFADCSGDSILAPLSGAEFRYGREARAEFQEDIEPEQADDMTMGMSCLLQIRELPTPQEFIPPAWAYRYPTCADLPNRDHKVEGIQNFWWLEIGGQRDTVHDAEELRDELLKIAFGVWDHIKNYCPDKEFHRNMALDWVGFLPGKRESRRYVGDHILTQNDVRAEGRFDDLIGYGGWTMDDHHPAGFHHPGPPNIFHPAPSPYGIPYRCLYSKNIANLFFAGRNISATHAAMSSTRVMATCSILGQAVGTAAALAAKYGLTPRGVYRQKLSELQQQLMTDDCYLPWQHRQMLPLTAAAVLHADSGQAEALRNGVDRVVGSQTNAWDGHLGDTLEYRWMQPQSVHAVRLVFDSNLQEMHNSRAFYPLHPEEFQVPPTLVKAFQLDGQGADGNWHVLHRETQNHQRLVRISLQADIQALRLTPQSTWGSENVRIFAWDVE